MEGVPPLKGRLEPWMKALRSSSGTLFEWIGDYGSPLNLINSNPFVRNLERLRYEGTRRGVDLEPFFARKANKCFSFVESCRENGYGVDVASEVELEQVLSVGVDPSKIVCTAAVKTAALLGRCIAAGVCIAIDNYDEMRAISSLAVDRGCRVNVALRLSGFPHEQQVLASRFGFPINEAWSVLDDPAMSHFDLRGIHFHLDGYDGGQRASALAQCIALSDRIQADRGIKLWFIDCGGGIPVSYLESRQQWDAFWKQHEAAVKGEAEEVTFGNNSYGRVLVDGQLYGSVKRYPFYQDLAQDAWLGSLLDSRCGEETVANAFKRRGLQLRLEPGRSALDGCGMTIAEIVFCKRHSRGEALIGLAMNHTQCRTSSVDFFVDPLLLRKGGSSMGGTACEGYFVGAYCTESEFISLRKFRFPGGANVGDLVAFPNTAGYFMHFLESRSHQFELAKNLDVSRERARLDRIDSVSEKE